MTGIAPASLIPHASTPVAETADEQINYTTFLETPETSLKNTTSASTFFERTLLSPPDIELYVTTLCQWKSMGNSPTNTVELGVARSLTPDTFTRHWKEAKKSKDKVKYKLTQMKRWRKTART